MFKGQTLGSNWKIRTNGTAAEPWRDQQSYLRFRNFFER